MGEEVLVSWVSAGLAVLSSHPALFVLPALFVPEGDFVIVLVYFFLYILFYVFVSVFFPHFCTGLLLCGCYM